MKNRFSTMSQTALGLCLLFSASGLMFSCSDDYDLDDKKPSFLGGSIYDELEARGAADAEDLASARTDAESTEALGRETLNCAWTVEE